MNHLDRVRDILPVAAALYAFLMVANFQAAQHPPHIPGLDAERLVSGLTWHMLQVARNEQSEAILFPGN